MKKFSSVFKTGAGAAVLFLMMPSMALSSVQQASESAIAVPSTVHKVSHSLAGNMKYSTTPSYKWGSDNQSTSTQATEWATNDTGQASYKWSASETTVTTRDTSNVFAGDATYSWGVRSYSDQAAYKWGFRSYSDQAAYKWGFRSYSDQAAYKWGFRSFADQAAYKWGFRSFADQAAYKWGFRSFADQAAYKWGFR